MGSACNISKYLQFLFFKSSDIFSDFILFLWSFFIHFFIISIVDFQSQNILLCRIVVYTYSL